MKLKLLAGLILGAGLALAQPRIAIGVGGYGTGYYAPPPRVYVPACPGPGYVWIEGYWDWSGGRSFWRNGSLASPTGSRHSLTLLSASRTSSARKTERTRWKISRSSS